MRVVCVNRKSFFVALSIIALSEQHFPFLPFLWRQENTKSEFFWYCVWEINGKLAIAQWWSSGRILVVALLSARRSFNGKLIRIWMYKTALLSVGVCCVEVQLPRWHSIVVPLIQFFFLSSSIELRDAGWVITLRCLIHLKLLVLACFSSDGTGNTMGNKSSAQNFLSSDVTEKERDSLSWTVLEWRRKKSSGLFKLNKRSVDLSEKIEINVNETQAVANLS